MWRRLIFKAASANKVVVRTCVDHTAGQSAKTEKVSPHKTTEEGTNVNQNADQSLTTGHHEDTTSASLGLLLMGNRFIERFRPGKEDNAEDSKGTAKKIDKGLQVVGVFVVIVYSIFAMWHGHQTPIVHDLIGWCQARIREMDTSEYPWPVFDKFAEY